MKVLQNLDEDRWTTLSEQERLDVLNVVCRIEARYLGIEPIKLSAENMPAGKRGATHWNSAEVVLNRKDLRTASSFDMLVAAIHESFHVYQHDLVSVYDQLDDSQRDLLCFRAVGVYKAEVENYINAVEDADAYMNQSLEQAAMCYSYDAAKEYLDAVAEYLNPPDTVE